MVMNLNPGGVVGALAGGGAAGVISYTIADGDPAAMIKWVIVLGLIAGAVGGNYLWTAVFGNRVSASDREWKSDRDPPDHSHHP
jgi:hypothetical protein